MGPLYQGHFGTLILVLSTEVSAIQRSLNTLQYYTGTQNGVLTTEVSAIQRFVIDRFRCITIIIGRQLFANIVLSNVPVMCYIVCGIS